jgi:hypothetical protein
LQWPLNESNVHISLWRCIAALGIDGVGQGLLVSLYYKFVFWIEFCYLFIFSKMTEAAKALAVQFKSIQELVTLK